jgi:hypothetical protein
MPPLSVISQIWDDVQLRRQLQRTTFWPPGGSAKGNTSGIVLVIIPVHKSSHRFSGQLLLALHQAELFSTPRCDY